MFLFMCRYSLCSVVYRFLKNNKRKNNKFVSYYLFTMCKFELIPTNKNMKKMTNSSGCLQQRHGSDCIAAQSDACLYPARHVLLILTREFLITKKSHQLSIIIFGRPTKWWQVRTYSNLRSGKLPLIASHVPLVS